MYLIRGDNILYLGINMGINPDHHEQISIRSSQGLSSWRCDKCTLFVAPTISNICVDLQTEQPIEMYNHLPTGLQRLLDWIS